MIKGKIVYILMFSLAAILLINSCKKDKSNPNGNLPHVYVNFVIDLTSIQYSDLDHSGGFIYLTGGANGILVYRSINDFYAYDRTCTLLSDSCKPIVMDKSNLFAVDNICKSKYIILDGSPDGNSPSKTPLIRYHADFDGQYLHVYN